MNISLLMFIIFNRYDKIDENTKFWVSILITYLCFNLIWGVIHDFSNTLNGLRFFIILLLITISPFIKGHHSYVRIFLGFSVLQAVFIIFVEAVLLLNNDIAAPLRGYVLQNNWGDIYTLNNVFYKIQLKGNALLPFALMVCLENPKKTTFNKIKVTILFFAILIAGNFAFYLGLIIYIILTIFKWKYLRLNNFKIVPLIIIIVLLIISPYIITQLSQIIQTKALESNPIRIDQAYGLFQDLGSNVIQGNGLGNTIDYKSTYRDYSGNLYFELQLLYIFNQIGIIGILLLTLTQYIISKKQFTARGQLIYFAYALYGFFNPYIIDTNHIIVLIILASLKREFIQKNDSINLRGDKPL